MKPEKFENGIKKVLGEREIKPSAAAWEKLDQRLERNKKSGKPYLLWIAAVAAVAVVFFTLGTFFNSPVPGGTPQLVEESVKKNVPEKKTILEEKTIEPEILQVAAAEEERKEKRASEIKPAENALFKVSTEKDSEAEILVASETTSEAPHMVTLENELLAFENKPEIATANRPAEVSDLEVEALLLLATAELKSDSVFTVNSGDLLHQVEYELDQSFRQKVFEVVKEGFSKAKTAVANREF